MERRLRAAVRSQQRPGTPSLPAHSELPLPPFAHPHGDDAGLPMADAALPPGAPHAWPAADALGSSEAVGLGEPPLLPPPPPPQEQQRPPRDEWTSLSEQCYKQWQELQWNEELGRRQQLEELGRRQQLEELARRQQLLQALFAPTGAAMEGACYNSEMLDHLQRLRLVQQLAQQQKEQQLLLQRMQAETWPAPIQAVVVAAAPPPPNCTFLDVQPQPPLPPTSAQDPQHALRLSPHSSPTLLQTPPSEQRAFAASPPPAPALPQSPPTLASPSAHSQQRAPRAKRGAGGGAVARPQAVRPTALRGAARAAAAVPPASSARMVGNEVAPRRAAAAVRGETGLSAQIVAPAAAAVLRAVAAAAAVARDSKARATVAAGPQPSWRLQPAWLALIARDHRAASDHGSAAADAAYAQPPKKPPPPVLAATAHALVAPACVPEEAQRVPKVARDQPAPRPRKVPAL